jgi:hypothetical protein
MDGFRELQQMGLLSSLGCSMTSDGFAQLRFRKYADNSGAKNIPAAPGYHGVSVSLEPESRYKTPYEINTYNTDEGAMGAMGVL